jgi:hypothetical protein
MQSLSLFTESPHCKSRLHCGICRNLADGRQWRRSLAKAFSLATDAVDFDCPVSKPWIGSGQSTKEKVGDIYVTPAPSKGASIPLAGDIIAAVTSKLGVDKATKKLARLLGKADCGCAARRARLNRLDARLRKRFLGK